MAQESHDVPAAGAPSEEDAQPISPFTPNPAVRPGFPLDYDLRYNP